MTPLTAPGVQPREVIRRSQSSPSTTGRGYGICSCLTVRAPACPRVSSQETVKDGADPLQGERVVDALSLVQACRPPEAQPAPLRPAVGPHPDVQGGCGPQGDGGPVAGDGESLDEYPPSLDRLRGLELDLVGAPAPVLVSVGQGGLRDGDDSRHQDGQGHDREPAHAGLPPPRLQRLSPVVAALLVPAVLAPALAEPAHAPVAALLAFAPLPVLAQPAQAAPDAFRHQAQRAGAAPHRLRRRGRLASHQLGDLPGVAPRPQPVLQQVGGHQGQPPTADLPHHHRHADQPEEDGQGHAHLGGADGGVAVGPVGQSEYGHHRHDLREGEAEQDLVLGLHVGRNLVFSHISFSFLTCPIR